MSNAYLSKKPSKFCEYLESATEVNNPEELDFRFVKESAGSGLAVSLFISIFVTMITLGTFANVISTLLDYIKNPLQSGDVFSMVFSFIFFFPFLMLDNFLLKYGVIYNAKILRMIKSNTYVIYKTTLPCSKVFTVNTSASNDKRVVNYLAQIDFVPCDISRERYMELQDEAPCDVEVFLLLTQKNRNINCEFIDAKLVQ